MKTICIIFLTLYSIQLLSQTDTSRELFPNGKLRFEYPMLKGKFHGLCRQWFENGQISSSAIFVNGVIIGKSINYFESGAIQMKSWYKNGAIIKSILYHKNGKKSLFTMDKLPKMRKQIFWNDSGQITMKIIEKNGLGISCYKELNRDIDKENEICYFGNIRVFFKNNTYVDSLGNKVNHKYRTVTKEWYNSGKLKSITQFFKGKTTYLIWDIHGKLNKKESN